MEQRSLGLSLTINFDSHVIKVFDENHYNEWTTSGQTYRSIWDKNTLKVELQPGYILKSVILTTGSGVAQQTLAISADGLSFNHPPLDDKSMGEYTLTITTTRPPKNINARIIFKHDTEANWKLATNFTPKAGELILYDPSPNDTNYPYDYTRIKLGDGSTKVNDLPFLFDKLHDLEVNLGSYLAFLVKEKGE